MASVSALARMYQQRIPTAPTTSKVGPRQTTAEDVRRVATYGRAAMPSTTQTRPATFALTPTQTQQIQQSLIGGPVPTIGEKNAGFSSQSQLQTAVLGEAIALRELGDLARQKANQALLEKSTRYTAPVASRLATAASMAGVRPGVLATPEERAGLAAGYGTVQRFGRTPEYEQIQRPVYGPDTMVERIQDPQTSQTFSANQLMQMAYESMLGRGPGGGYAEQTPEMQAQLADLAASQGMGRAAVVRGVAQPGTAMPEVARYERFKENAPSLYPEIGGQAAIADLIQETPIYEYARQLAQSKYGMDPNLAAGLFTPETDIAYRKLQSDYELSQQGYVPMSDAEYIYMTMGPDAYYQWRDQNAYNSVYGTPAQQEKALTAEEEAANLEFDLGIQEKVGFMPSQVKGYDAETVRQAFYDTGFNGAVQKLAEGFRTQGGISIDDATNIVDEYLASNATNPTAPLNARILEAIVASFNTNTGAYTFGM